MYREGKRSKCYPGDVIKQVSLLLRMIKCLLGMKPTLEYNTTTDCEWGTLCDQTTKYCTDHIRQLFDPLLISKRFFSDAK